MIGKRGEKFKNFIGQTVFAVEYPAVFISLSLGKKNDVKTTFEAIPERSMKKQNEKKAKDPRAEMIADAVSGGPKNVAVKKHRDYKVKPIGSTCADLVLESRHPPKGNKSPW